MDNYIKIEKIGEGTYGIVFKGKCKKTGNYVAIKKIRMDHDEEGIPSTSIREVSILKELVHPNIVGLQDVIMEDDKLYLVFEYLTMDLKKFFDTYEPGKLLDPALVKSYTYQILQALLFCHKRRILHRDLKPQNLLVSPNGIIKVADFGLGRAYSVPLKVLTHEIVTLWYRAPEVLLGSTKYAHPVDVWSIGCILGELCNRKPIFRGDSEIDQLFNIFRILTTPTENEWPGISQLPDYKSSFPGWTRNVLSSHVKNLEPNGLDLLRQMLIYDPPSRITCKDAIKHPYFDDLDKSKLPCYD